MIKENDQQKPEELLDEPEAQTFSKRKGVKAVACGFCFIVLSGNFWLVFILFNHPTPIFIELGFIFGIVLVILGGLLMSFEFLKGSMRSHE